MSSLQVLIVFCGGSLSIPSIDCVLLWLYLVLALIVFCGAYVSSPSIDCLCPIVVLSVFLALIVSCVGRVSILSIDCMRPVVVMPVFLVCVSFIYVSIRSTVCVLWCLCFVSWKDFRHWTGFLDFRSPEQLVFLV